MSSLERLASTPPWEWPEDAAETLSDVLRDESAAPEDQQLAAQLAGDITVVDDAMVELLLGVLADGKRAEDVRATAAIALGPVLEQCDTDGFDEDSDSPISEPTFRRTRKRLSELYRDADLPVLVRRRILEAAVRAPEAWHEGAIRAAYASGDPDWVLTAVFCMQYVRGFDEEILESLRSKDAEILYEAVQAAGNAELDAAWKQIAALVTDSGTEKALRLAAIEAVVSIRPEEATELLLPLEDSPDEDIREAVEEALSLAGVLSDLDE
jgi:hypothetical protein